MVSTRAFRLCDPCSIPAQCSYHIKKIPPWLYVRRVFPVSLYLYQTPQVFSEYSGFLLHKHWTSRENSLVMTDRVSLYIVYLSLFAGG